MEWKEKFKQFFNKKNLKYSLQVIIWTIFFFIQFWQKGFYDIKSITDSLNLNFFNVDIFQIILPCKTVMDLYQFFGLTFIFVQLVLCVVTIPLFILLFVYKISGENVDNEQKVKINYSIKVEDHKTDYKIISRYLC